MKVLLDTQAFLWMIADGERLSSRARQVLQDPDSRLYFSAASLWEISIKLSVGKLELADDWPASIRREMQINTIQWLPVEMEHCVQVSHLPFHHRDPFDRMLIAQAMVEDMTLLSSDHQMKAYAARCIW
jgi:PIN domain nuclease of toxin-antitoxin system